MTKTTHLPPMLPLSPLLFFLLLFFSSSSLLHLVAAEARNSSNSTGISFKLIHRDSIFSPLHPGNLTASQWFRRQVEHSKSHIQRLQSSIMETPNKVVTPRPAVAYVDHVYMVILAIGTPPIDYFLILDSGSDLTWTQCIPCDPCHNQMNLIFTPEHSSTYSNLPCDHPLCKPPYVCVDGRCTFDIAYGGGGISKGDFARESFTFLSNTKQRLVIHNIAFGCSFKASDQFFDGAAAGILGLGGGIQSILLQLGDLVEGRFSYCLVDNPSSQSSKYSYLRFGQDMTLQDPIQIIPFVQTNNPTVYYLNLRDISIDDYILPIPAGTFERSPDGQGGFFIDSGSALSFLKTEAYQVLKNGLTLYFASYQLQLAHPPREEYPTDLCFEIPEVPTGPIEFPSITFHFDTAGLTPHTSDLKIDPLQLFHFNDEARYFCLAMFSSPSFSILGAMQQANYRFEYDVRTQLLAFAPENCGAESG